MHKSSDTPPAYRRRAAALYDGGMAPAPNGFDPLFEQPPTLEGIRVRMEPFAERHRDGLWTALGDPAVWRWVKIDASAGREVFDAWFDEAVAGTAARAEFGFVTVAQEDDRPVGSSRFLALRPADRGLEIGWSLVSPEAWGTGANTEAKLLMLTHAFEQLGCARVEFKTDARNERSRAALAAIPARFEGVLRNHMIVPDVGQRDSAYYSVIDSEWPAVRDNLRRRLAGAPAR
jgi:RimJ/RimL family protein N-acetyltransferase